MDIDNKNTQIQQGQDQGNQGQPNSGTDPNNQGQANVQNPAAGGDQGKDANDQKGEDNNSLKQLREHNRTLEKELSEFRKEKKEKEEAEALKRGEFDTIKQSLESERDDWKGKYENLIQTQALQKVLLGEGINPKYLDVAGGLIKAQDGVEFDEQTGQFVGIDAAKFKELYPEMFQSTQQQGGGYQVGVHNVSTNQNQGAGGVSVDLTRFSQDSAYRDSLSKEQREYALKQLKL